MRHSLLLALVWALAAVPAHALTTVQITTNVTSNTTWGPTGTVVGDVFWVRNSISISAGKTLTIQPGVVVKFDLYRQLTVSGRLRAVGTAADTIVVTSIRDDNNRGGDTNTDGNATLPAPSDWYGISFPDASPDSSLLQYCDIRYGGYTSGGAVTFISATDSMVNCVIRRSYHGIDCQGTASPVLVNTSIEASTRTPLVLDFTATPVFSSVVFSSSDNGYDALGLRGGTLTGSATLPKRGATIGGSAITNVTYVLLGNLTVDAAASLTINPGVVIKPLAAYWITVNGNLTMNGTLADTITVTSISDDNFGQPRDTNNNGSLTAPDRNDWGGVTWNQGATGSVQYCRFKFGSSSTTRGMVEMTNLSIPVSNTLFSDAAHGLVLHGVSQPAISTVAINNMSSTPTLMSVSANPVFTNITLLGNSITALGIIGEANAADAHLYPRTLAGYVNMTYYVMTSLLQMVSPAILTVDPGVVVKFQQAAAGLQIDGALIADGKPESLIVFTSERDDQYGNPADTNGDGSITTPNTGDWPSIHFTATSNDALCRMDNCRVTYATYYTPAYPGAIHITSAAPTITYCTVSKAYYGFQVDGNATPVIDHCTITNCTRMPIAMSATSDPTLTNNSFSTNGYNGLGLLSETLAQDAVLKYRSGVGSPPFAYVPVGTITIGTGATLAIQPNVVIKPMSNFSVFDVNGSLRVVGGTGAQRVVFTSVKDDAWAGDTNADGSASSPGAYDWGGINFYDTSLDAQCVLRNCLFQFGYQVVTTTSASPRLAALEFFQNTTAFVFKGNSQASVDSTTILNCTYLPIIASLISDPSLTRITLANNALTALGILGETVAQDVRTRVRAVATYSNIAYALAGNVTIAFGAKWTIDPGVVIKAGTYYAPYALGMSISIDGALSARGKSDSLIVFTAGPDDAFGGDLKGDGAATLPTSDDWSGIAFSSVSNDSLSMLKYCRFRYASNGLAFTSAADTVSNCVFQQCEIGAYIAGNSAPVFINTNMDSCTTLPVRMSLVSNPVFSNVQFLGNAVTALGVIAETIAQDLRWPIRAVSGRLNMPYFVDGTLSMGLGSTVTMQPGLIVKLKYGSIIVQRALTAVGRTQSDSLIVFTSYSDDFYGGDTDNNGSARLATTGDWYSVKIEDTAIDAQVQFRNCVFRYGYNSASYGAVRCVNASPAIDSCTFAYNGTGVTAEGASNPVFHGCSFYANTNYGVNNVGGSFCVWAQGCWWGSASGPKDASATADLCALTTNTSSGDAVSNNVDYRNWATTGTQGVLLGDVSLSGAVTAYDASLVLQYVVSLISLSAQQKLAADVSGTGGITAYDASLILQYVAGVIRVFPAESTGPVRPPALTSLRAGPTSARVALGTATWADGAWQVPVSWEADADAHAVEFALAATDAPFLGAALADGQSAALEFNAVGGRATVAVASVSPLARGALVVLRFAGDAAWQPPALTRALVDDTPALPEMALPSATRLGAPQPNPARDHVSFTLQIADRHAGATVRLDVLNAAGRRVADVFAGALPAGMHPFTWTPRDAHGAPLPAGIYFLRASVGDVSASRRLALTR